MTDLSGLVYQSNNQVGFEIMKNIINNILNDHISYKDFKWSLSGVLGLSRRALRTFGALTELDKALEELTELQHAIYRFKAGKGSEADIVEEIADVLVVCSHLMVLYGCDEVVKQLEFKLNRLEEIVKERKKHYRVNEF